MASHGICFDFYYRPKLSQIGQNGLAAAADTRLAEFSVRMATFWLPEAPLALQGSASLKTKMFLTRQIVCHLPADFLAVKKEFS